MHLWVQNSQMQYPALFLGFNLFAIVLIISYTKILPRKKLLTSEMSYTTCSVHYIRMTVVCEIVKDCNSLSLYHYSCLLQNTARVVAATSFSVGRFWLANNVTQRCVTPYKGF